MQYPSIQVSKYPSIQVSKYLISASVLALASFSQTTLAAYSLSQASINSEASLSEYFKSFEPISLNNNTGESVEVAYSGLSKPSPGFTEDLYAKASLQTGELKARTVVSVGTQNSSLY